MRTDRAALPLEDLPFDAARAPATAPVVSALPRWHVHVLSLGAPAAWLADLPALAARWGYTMGQARVDRVADLVAHLGDLPPADLLLVCGDAATLAGGRFEAAHWRRALRLEGQPVLHLGAARGDAGLAAAFVAAGAAHYLAPREALRGDAAQAYVLERLRGWREWAVQAQLLRHVAPTPPLHGAVSTPLRHGAVPPAGPARPARPHSLRSAARPAWWRWGVRWRRAGQALLSASWLGVSPALGLVGLAQAPAAVAHEDHQSEAAVQAALMAQFDRPDARLVVKPVTVVGRHAVAGWLQGERGGRALLERDAHGAWQVVLCAGEALRDADFLRQAGLGRAMAERMALAVDLAERDLGEHERARLASFEGLVRMDAHGGHPPVAGHGAGHGTPGTHAGQGTGPGGATAPAGHAPQGHPPQAARR